jgi:hypothetical protein
VNEKTVCRHSFEAKKIMKKVILINGLIAGVIVSAMFLISHPFVDRGQLSFDSGMVVGYTSMVIALSMIFFGVRSYRDRELNGTISFGKALGMGLLIALVAGTIYGLTWDVYYRFFGGDEFMVKFTEYTVTQMKKDGASVAEIAATRTEWEQFNRNYQNFFVRFAFTLMEILPVGLLISLITAAIVRTKTPVQHGVID